MFTVLLLSTQFGADPRPQFSVAERPAFTVAVPYVAPVRPRHVSPDGTINELGADGVYRPVPGAPRQKTFATPPTAPVRAPFAAPNVTCVTGRG